MSIERPTQPAQTSHPENQDIARLAGAGDGPSSRSDGAPASSTGSPWNRAWTHFAIWAGVATLFLGPAWITTIRGSIADKLYSYVLLVPFISGWLVWQNRTASKPATGRAVLPGAVLIVSGVAIAMAGAWARKSGWITEESSWLTTQLGGWVAILWGLVGIVLGWGWAKPHIFALGFLAFTIPLPEPAVHLFETGLQRASATAADWLFQLAGTPYIRHEMTFWFPNVHIEVAPECSGIRSTLVLFITGILGSYLLLRRTIHRVTLASAVIPLGIARNAFRITTLTLLSVHVDPQIMRSALHHRGGPLFFAVSLIPLFLMFWWFSRREKQAAGSKTPRTPSQKSSR